MLSTKQIRQNFLDYFVQNKHQAMASSPLIPQNDPSLMFANAGMNQFKNIIIGLEEPKHRRVTTSQKCVRAGGKHNDLDNVGYTARHHTFFEMLGNFSFGDYFKEEAIFFAWQLLTEVFALPKDKLLTTVYHNDDEAFNLWKKLGVSENKIIRIATDDNFWAMGDTGPCGPCSEIFYDHGAHIPGGPPGSADADGDRFIEIWNLVFMQYNRDAEGVLHPLPNPCIDTGMGLERVTTVLQDVDNNFKIDLFRHLQQALEDLAKKKADETNIASYRVIIDHLRAMGFLIADGVLPSNEGRGYVLRRIMRRAMRHVYQIGASSPIIYRLVQPLISEMGDVYPELGRAEDLIIETIKFEEERFAETLGRGIKLLELETAELKSGEKLDGTVAFKLYDTFGFPLDLTTDILRAKSITVDLPGFDREMAKQKAMARQAWAGSGAETMEKIWFELAENLGATEFIGYTYEKGQGLITDIIENGKQVEIADKIGEKYAIITNQTPFYGESGGQAGDKGTIITKDGEFTVFDTKKYLGKLFVHFGVLTKGKICKEQTAELAIDLDRRRKLRANHTATHLLHQILRNVLGKHVTQKGSLVEADYFRFDFSHTSGLTKEQIKLIEQKVNQLIFRNLPVGTKVMPVEQAITSGALALFGEKYDNEVRVITVLDHEEKIPASVELCGGTHVRNTGEIGCFKISSESSVAAGIRRIEAVTNMAAIDYLNGYYEVVQELQRSFNCNEDEILVRVEQLSNERKNLSKQISQLKLQAVNLADKDVSEIESHKLAVKVVDDIPPKELRNLSAKLWRNELDVLAIFSRVEGKVAISCQVGAKLQEKLDAIEIAKLLAEATGGSGGGGQKNIAQAGGVNAGAINQAVEKLYSKVKSL